MSEVFKGDTVYMTFPHTRTGALRGDWTMKMAVNGTARSDIPVQIVEATQYIYVASFANDGDDNSYWTLYLLDTLDQGREYFETWRVRSRAIENNIKQIRSRQDSEGGFFKGNSGDNQ